MTINRQALYKTLGANDLKSGDIQTGKSLFETLVSSCKWQTLYFFLSLSGLDTHTHSHTKSTLKLRLPDTDRKTCSCSDFFMTLLWERSQRQAKGVIISGAFTQGWLKMQFLFCEILTHLPVLFGIWKQILLSVKQITVWCLPNSSSPILPQHQTFK